MIAQNSTSPGLHPHTNLPEYVPESEKKVSRALTEALPSGWYAWHSIKLRNRRGEYSEGDFIIADPVHGLLVLEVKGGQVVKKEGEWFQSGKSIHPPLHQALFFRKCLLSVFQEKNLTAPPIGVAVAFPDMYTATAPSQGDLKDVVITARELQYLEEILPDLFGAALPKYIPMNPSPEWIDFLHELWCECWPLQMNLSMRIREGMKSRNELDPNQFNILQSVMENERAVIKGGAGTGKTLLALILALKEAEAGKSVLLLTFTEALADELAKQTEGANITVSPIGRLALRFLRQRGFKEKEVYAPEFWERVTRKAGAFHFGRQPEKWDVVIIDEGQDMGRYEWRYVHRCMKKVSSLRVFIDPNQAFWESKEMPSSMRDRCAVFNLIEPYRCPPSIQALADAYLGKTLDIDKMRSALEERIVGIEAVSGGSDIHEAVRQQIDHFINDGFQPYEIAVISLRGFMFEGNIAHCEKLGKNILSKATDKDASARIVCDSFLRFKGLERPAVIVTDLRYVSDKYETRMNIAVTRAMGILRIVAEEGQVERDDILKRLAGMGHTE